MRYPELPKSAQHPIKTGGLVKKTLSDGEKREIRSFFSASLTSCAAGYRVGKKPNFQIESISLDTSVIRTGGTESGRTVRPSKPDKFRKGYQL